MEDGEILQMYWERDPEAISATAAQYGAYCFAIAKNILGNDEDAEECVNDAYLRAWNSIPPHRPQLLSAFLGKLTRNLSLNRYRSDTAGKRGGGAAAAVLDELAECISGQPGVEQELEQQELIRAIDAFLAALPPEQRGIFLCRYWYFDSVSAIAKRYRFSETRVSVTLHRLRKRLRHHLSERGFEL